jgi:hypothetical protein
MVETSVGIENVFGFWFLVSGFYGLPAGNLTAKRGKYTLRFLWLYAFYAKGL